MRTSRNAPAAPPRPPVFATARRWSPARRSATSGTGLHLALGIVTALYQRTTTGRGQKVTAAMQDGVLNLARVKLRDQQRLAHGPLKEYSQFGEGIPFGDAVPRAGNDSGGGQPGRILKCKGWETDPNAYIYFITQAPVWEKICDVIGEPDWKTHPDYAKPAARLKQLNAIFARIEQWTMTKTKFEAMDILNEDDIPCGPILSMKELIEDQSLRATGTVVEVDHPDARQVSSRSAIRSSCRTARPRCNARRCSASTPTRFCDRCWASPTIRWPRSTIPARSIRRARPPPSSLRRHACDRSPVADVVPRMQRSAPPLRRGALLIRGRNGTRR